MQHIIELETPLESPLSEVNQENLKSFDPLGYFPENESIIEQNLGIVFWLDDENNLVAGTETFVEQVHLAFWRISDDRMNLTYSHIECL